MTETPTPETDALASTHDEATAWVGPTTGYTELLDHSRKLERERNQARQERDEGTEKLLRDLLDRAYKMMLMAGYRVAEIDSDHNDPIIAWMTDARRVLYGATKPQPDLEQCNCFYRQEIAGVQFVCTLDYGHASPHQFSNEAHDFETLKAELSRLQADKERLKGDYEALRLRFAACNEERERQHTRAEAAEQRIKALLEAAIMVRDDMILRAQIGTKDGDHDVQMSNGAWLKLNAAIDKAIQSPR